MLKIGRFFTTTLVILFLCASLFSQCKTPTIDQSTIKLIGGSELPENERPSVRKLSIFDKNLDGSYSQRSICTMTFIRNDLAITAAHCLCKGDRFIYSDADQWEDYQVIKAISHPKYDCLKTTPNSYDVALVWFDPDLKMAASKLILGYSPNSISELTLVGYGDDILKITGSFWLGTRRAVTQRSKPSTRRGELEFKGKRAGNVIWLGDSVENSGFMRITTIYDVLEPIQEEMTEATSAIGDSGGPAFLGDSDIIIGLISRGGMRFTGIGSTKVECVTDLVDLRRSEIQGFLRDNGILK